jgi:hypothetical protein
MYFCMHSSRDIAEAFIVFSSALTSGIDIPYTGTSASHTGIGILSISKCMYLFVSMPRTKTGV